MLLPSLHIAMLLGLGGLILLLVGVQLFMGMSAEAFDRLRALIG